VFCYGNVCTQGKIKCLMNLFSGKDMLELMKKNTNEDTNHTKTESCTEKLDKSNNANVTQTPETSHNFIIKDKIPDLDKKINEKIKSDPLES
jgi:hypothetical protein